MVSTLVFYLLLATFAMSLGNSDFIRVKRADDIIVTDHDLNVAIKFARDSVSRMQRLEISLKNADKDVTEDSPSHGQLITSYPTGEALAYGKEAMIVNKASKYLINRHCAKNHISVPDCIERMKNWTLSGTPLKQKCVVQFKTMQCPEGAKYRNIDGSCNHPKHPSWGQAYSPYLRLLPARYADGISDERRAQNRRPLPSARQISDLLVPDNDKPATDITLALAQWSQFISNDMFQTPVAKMVYTGLAIECCRPDGKPLTPRYIHPSCLQIQVPPSDPDYSEQRVSCMNYVRSLSSLRSQCNFGPADQMNQATHYLDASNIYGSSPVASMALRTMSGGRLDTSGNDNEEFLPLSPVPELKCQNADNDTVCYHSGDSRVNQHPHQTAMYTLWVREHNRIADILLQINPFWDDSRLFQEARRIVIAEIQHITYSSWAPLLLGKAYTKNLKLDIKSKGFSSTYNEEINPDVSNSLATAGFSFVNSMFQKELGLYDDNRQLTGSLQLRQHFNSPGVMQNPGIYESLLRGLSTQPAQAMDASCVDDVTSQLYRGFGKFGHDAISLDVQRGRDHGIPGYNAYRRYCSLPTSSRFETLGDSISKTIVNKLKSVYAHPEDVDLVIGAILEKPDEDAKIGPTFRCLLGEQLVRTRKGDRFFYDLPNLPHSFTEGQINELKKASLARVLCDNARNIQKMQPNVFFLPSSSNPLLQCDDSRISFINLNLWKEIRL